MSDLISRKEVLDILDQCARDILVDYGLHGLLYECMEEIEKLQTVELCEDCVSRKSAVEAVRDHDWMQAVFTIAHLPSVEPERKTGHWHLLDECANEGWYCDQCHKKVFRADFSNTMRKYKFCPNCGARMEADDGERDSC